MKKTNAKELSYGTIPKLDLKMRITFLLLIVTFFQLKASSGYGQKTIISLNLTEVPIKAAFAEIESLTEFRFFYKNIDLDLNRKVTLKFKKKPINSILEELFKDQKIDFEVFDTQIVLKKSSERTNTLQKSNSTTTQPQQFKVNGTITDDSGTPLPGATIVEKGTLNGTQSDFDGNYDLEVNNDAILIISYIGFVTKEISVGTQQTINVTLSENTAALDEVVVVGYGTKRKKDIISAVSVVDLEEVADVPAAGISRLLLGQAPGVNVASSSGRPGQNLDISIRGLGSLGAGNDPLWVIDGFPLESSDGLNPNEIESISILKDAASTAIYGARGSNGVILVTTKKGKVGKTSVTLDVTTGFQNVPKDRRVDMMNAVEFGEFQKSSWIDRYIASNGSEPSESEIPEGIRNPENNTISTDWMDEILANSPLFTKYDLSIASGNEKTQSLITLGYMDQDGVVIKTNFERFNVRAKIDNKITDNITVGLNLSGSRTNERIIGAGNRHTPVGLALWVDPREPVYNEDGSFNAYLGDKDTPGDLIFNSANPVQILHEQKTTLNTNRLLANSYAEFKFLKDFTFKSTLNASLVNSRYNQFTPSTLSGFSWNQPAPNNAVLNERYDETFNWSADQLLSYSKVLNEVHNVNALLGYTSQESTFRAIGGNGSKFPDDDVRFLQQAESIGVDSQESSWSLLAYFAQINYTFKNKYLVSATYRREGSSRFGSNNRWGNFPAISAGWRISEEAPLKDTSWLNDLKLRASFGATGNNDIGNYPSLSTLSTTNYIFGGSFQPGKILNSLSNPNLGWEKSEQFDYGIDLTMFNNRLSFVAEYYKKTTTDMLLPVNIPVITGFETTFTNIGKVENTGIELGLNYRTNITEDLKFRSNFNISFNKNKVLEIDGDNDEIRTGGIYGAHHVSQVGRPIAMLHGFRNLGVFQSQAEIDASPIQDGAVPGSFKYWDANGDGEVTYDFQDFVEIGNPHPEFVYAFNMGLDYKAFDLNVVFTGAQNYEVFTEIEHTTMNMDGVFNVEVRAADRFRYTTMSGDAGPTSNFWKWEREGNSWYISDASHVWLRSLSLGYTIPTNENSFVDGVRVYVNGDNLLLFTGYEYGNPQPNDRGELRPGVDETPYPLARTVSLGATFKF
ncbi:MULTISPECIES: SusC/RagA family TonB-linked outer membrane protein [Arenibacter]|uniref:SusC/RagA family TonB-linked outer membrane protein n=1 Tax=Arenibacter TaxID=178469 RepID=UPI00068B4D9E|nr:MULTISPECIES: TonB-dependent receptor [Arenibacter]GBF20181.1 tonB dependent receptor [Arenibacter sp. NBRC 103722]